MSGLTKQEKGWVRVVEEYVDRNLRTCLEDPTSAVVSLNFVGIEGKVLEYARALVHAPKGE